MNMRYLVAGLIAVVLAASSFGAPADKPNQQDWIGVRCAAYNGEHCRMPFAALFAQPYRIAQLGSKVRLKGYLVYERGLYSLYPDKNAAELGWENTTVKVFETDDPAIRESLKRWDQSFVQIDGAVVLQASDSDERWLSFKPDKPISVTGIRGGNLR